MTTFRQYREALNPQHDEDEEIVLTFNGGEDDTVFEQLEKFVSFLLARTYMPKSIVDAMYEWLEENDPECYDETLDEDEPEFWEDDLEEDSDVEDYPLV